MCVAQSHIVHSSFEGVMVFASFPSSYLYKSKPSPNWVIQSSRRTDPQDQCLITHHVTAHRGPASLPPASFLGFPNLSEAGVGIHPQFSNSNYFSLVIRRWFITGCTSLTLVTFLSIICFQRNGFLINHYQNNIIFTTLCCIQKHLLASNKFIVLW